MSKIHTAEADKSDAVETQQQDVVGLRIPRKRVLLRYEVTIKTDEIPRRKPHVSVPQSEDNFE
jgi:hypothetical protein